MEEDRSSQLRRWLKRAGPPGLWAVQLVPFLDSIRMELRTVLALAFGDHGHKALRAIASRRADLFSSNSEV